MFIEKDKIIKMLPSNYQSGSVLLDSYDATNYTLVYLSSVLFFSSVYFTFS
jgi:hypothetical protein